MKFIKQVVYVRIVQQLNYNLNYPHQNLRIILCLLCHNILRKITQFINGIKILSEIKLLIKNNS